MAAEDKAVEALIAEWNIHPDISITREQILEALALRIAALLAGDSERFFQMMYRLDINETKLNAAFDASDPPGAFAILIWDRQLEKARSRERYSRPQTGNAGWSGSYLA